jgi:hypothetical protein
VPEDSGVFCYDTDMKGIPGHRDYHKISRFERRSHRQLHQPVTSRHFCDDGCEELSVMESSIDRVARQTVKAHFAEFLQSLINKVNTVNT